MALEFSYFGGLVCFTLTYLEAVLIPLTITLILHFGVYIYFTRKFSSVYDKFTIFNIVDYFLPPFMPSSSLSSLKWWKGYGIFILEFVFVPVYVIIACIDMLVYTIRELRDNIKGKDEEDEQPELPPEDSKKKEE